jgi:chaperonin GroEL
MIEKSTDEYDKKKMQERLAKLDGGVGIISVGAKTESELREKKDLVDDAFCACKAAVANGIVPGGGIALLLAKNELYKYTSENSDEFVGDEILGAKVLWESLDAPIRKILENAGESADIIMAEIYDNQDENFDFGYDVLNKKFGKMLDLGIIDPSLVIISEVKNASSIASLLLTTSASIVEEKTEEKTPSMPNSMMGGMGMPGMGMM